MLITINHYEKINPNFTCCIYLPFLLVKRKLKRKKTISTYYLIRHAEKDRSDKTNTDPNLTEDGLKRAENWANHFKDLKFDMVYSTNYNRTKQTAMPTAKANNVDLQFYNPSDIEN